VLTLDNRSFRYGDGLFETMRIASGKVHLLHEHLQRLSHGAKILKMKLPADLNVDFMERSIMELAKKNGITTDGRVRLSVFRKSGGHYTPEDNQVLFAIEAYPVEEKNYILNSKGLIVDLYTEYRKTPNALASIKSSNSLIFVLAGLYKNEHKLDECILSNDKGQIIEAISSNLFAVKNGVLYTPPVTDGCIHGVMRNKIIQIAQANRIAVYEISVMQNVLLGADELFLTNAVHGIRWVVAYKQKRYFNTTSKKLVEKLNEALVNGQ
jgi:branched-subunit amino acid aminotransferase/4-amino-4-deoxychorismate lyase